jgi:hypothetical protein
MVEGAPAILVALEQSGFAAAIRQSPWLYPAANIGHIVALVCFAGAVAVLDVRLLGGAITADTGRLLARARACAMAGFAAMAITGFALFAAEASHVALNPVFQLKVALIAAGLINVALYEVWGKPAVQGLAPGSPIPRNARLEGSLSLAIWIAVAACGRSIAYF